MSASSSSRHVVFRSHLMQQFAAAARNQARTTPPIALFGWIKHEQQQQQSGSDEESSSCSPQTSTRQRQLNSIGLMTTTTTPQRSPFLPPSANTGSTIFSRLDVSASASSRKKTRKSTSRGMSTLSTTSESASDNNDDSSVSPIDLTVKDKGAAFFQSVLRSRHTTSKFLKPLQYEDSHTDKDVPPPPRLLLTADQYRVAIHRAVVAGRTAPNHKRTEPYTFKRLLGPSSETQRLAEIAAQVHLRQQHSNFKGGGALSSVQAAANSKREKWSQIPAFLVTLVSSVKKSQAPTADEASSSRNNKELEEDHYYNDDLYYSPLPYRPPETERELEDYAAACAATQNILLSLHAEDVATKWATGPVVRTPAFRKLVQAAASDRVVALIMIGQEQQQAASSSSSPNKQRRYRRDLIGDVLVDL